MSKRRCGLGSADLFPEPYRKRHPHLVLPKYLAEEAERLPVTPAELERVAVALNHWADLAGQGHLAQKETSLDSEFLQRIFGEALGYKSITESPDAYHREKNPTVPGAGAADGALGLFVSGKDIPPSAVIELKGADADLDHDKFNGRTPVQQCWDYLNQLPDTQWGIVSNYVTIRLYHKGSPARAYEQFTVADFRDPVRRKQFYFLFERSGLLGNPRANDPGRAARLLKRTQTRQREVGDKLYKYYAEQRGRLIEELMQRESMPQDTAIRVAQKLLDRVIFTAFCEDRGLLPERLLDQTWKSVPPLARAGRRWQNFVEMFNAIDKGHEALDLPTGYNGGLFEHDPLADKLSLDRDPWTDVFKNIGEYDFREEGEINVDVLGHIFERSITELEKLRVVGLFGKHAERVLAAMPKSAERKRFGIYYTPPQFTRLIVEETLGKLIAERVDPLPDLKDRVTALRKLTVCDPACGSGAFLIAAYERLEDAYEEVARQLRIAGHLQEALNLTNAYPDYILSDNLYGVDLSAEAVEITQLALWIRSARKGKALSDLSKNIVHGNSLVSDPAMHERAMDWPGTFPKVFGQPAPATPPKLRPAGCAPPVYRPPPEAPARVALPVPGHGFDCVIGNPPWERIKQQKREFFSVVPEVIAEPNPAKARKLIESFEVTQPALFARWRRALDGAASMAAHLRGSGEYPLSAVGDTNYANVFAELSRKLVAPHGRVGLLVPSGIATDNTTKDFFADLMASKALRALYDFENRKLIFPDVDGRFKFSVLLMNGAETRTEAARFVFFAHAIEDLAEPNRRIDLTIKDLRLLNPNTRTCPIFRTQRDAELTRSVYRTTPVLVDRNRKSGGNPWGFAPWTMFHQSGDAELFVGPLELTEKGYSLDGAVWRNGDSRYLPLYEAKMVQAYDHRAASVQTEAGNWLRHGQTEDTTLVEHQNPEFTALPRWWANESDVRQTRAGSNRWGFVGFKDISSATNQRTMIAAAIPWSAVTHHFPLLDVAATARRQMCFLGNLNSLAYDFLARQKLGGTTFGFYHLEQLPTLPPDAYDERCPWAKSKKLEDWVAERVLKLTCTADDMRPLAEAAGFEPGVWKWREDERAKLRAELDAAYFHLYGLDRADVEYILGTFQGVVKEDEAHGGAGRTRQLVLEAYDEMAQ